MIAAARAVLRRDLLLAMRRRGDVATALLFFVIVASLFPLGIGAEPPLRDLPEMAAASRFDLTPVGLAQLFERAEVRARVAAPPSSSDPMTTPGAPGGAPAPPDYSTRLPSKLLDGIPHEPIPVDHVVVVGIHAVNHCATAEAFHVPI